MAQMLGVLGGLGPMATVYFYELLTRHTQAVCDQQHLDVVISSRASTPDRTAYILGQSAQSPFAMLADDAARLVAFGADVLAIPCNTAHYFYERLCARLTVPVLNMVEQTVLQAKRRGSTRVGVLATSGTVQAGTYAQMCARHGLECIVPGESGQAAVMQLIYGVIKQGCCPQAGALAQVVQLLRSEGCTHMILGCTELSLWKKEAQLDALYIDSMQVLAKCAIELLGKTPVGFEEELL